MKRESKKSRPIAFLVGLAAGKLAAVAWSYRVEAALTAAFFALWRASVMVGPLVAVVAWVAALAALAWPFGKKRLGGSRWLFGRLDRLLLNARARRQVERAARHSGFPGLRVGRVRRTLPGETVAVRVPRGQTVARLEQSSRAIAGCLRVSDVRVLHDRLDRSRADLSVIRRDVFSGMPGVPWPLVGARSTSVRQPMPLGLNEFGEVVKARLLSRNLLVGGAPDSGKSACLRMFAAYAALDPRCKLWMMDGKDPGVEFTLWSGAADGLVLGREVSDAADMLSDLAKRVSSRYQEMVRRNVDFIGEDMDLDVLMIDEAPQFTRSFEGDTKPQQVAVKAIKEGVWKLIAIGRAAGMITIVSAQKPTADIIPSESRDLIDNKLALHCNTRAASKAIVGDGESDDVPADATEIPSGQPGVGFYVGDGGVQKVKTFFIPREHAAEISSRVTSCHLDRELEHLR